MGGLAGKVAIVTGAGLGIGAAIDRADAREGGKVVVTGRTRAKLDEVASVLPTTSPRTPL